MLLFGRRIQMEPRDEGTKGPRDQGTKGPRDQGTKGPRDQGTKGPRDQGFEGLPSSLGGLGGSSVLGVGVGMLVLLVGHGLAMKMREARHSWITIAWTRRAISAAAGMTDF